MAPRNLVEFVRLLANGRGQPCGNRVQLEDANGNAITPIINGGDVNLRNWYYLGHDYIGLDGDEQVTLPAGTTAFVIEAEGGSVYYNINGADCDAEDSYIAEDGMRSVGPMANLTSLWVYGVAAGSVPTVYAHIQFWRLEA